MFSGDDVLLNMKQCLLKTLPSKKDFSLRKYIQQKKCFVIHTVSVDKKFLPFPLTLILFLFSRLEKKFSFKARISFLNVLHILLLFLVYQNVNCPWDIMQSDKGITVKRWPRIGCMKIGWINLIMYIVNILFQYTSLMTTLRLEYFQYNNVFRLAMI